MVPVAFATLILMAFVNGIFWLAMRIRLMRIDSARDRIEWLSLRSGDDVLDTYAALFPKSIMPGYCRFVFWMCIVSAAVVLCSILISKAFRG